MMTRRYEEMKSILFNYLTGSLFIPLLCVDCPQLTVQQVHVGGRVSLTGRRKGSQDLVNAGHIVLSQVNDGCVLTDAVRVGGTRDGDDLGHARATGQGDEPVDGDLAGGAALLLGDGLNGGDELEVLGEVFTLPARVDATEIALGKFVERLDLATEEASAKGS